MSGRNKTDIIYHMEFTLNRNQNYIRIKKCCYETHYQILRTNIGPTNTSGEGTNHSIKQNLILKKFFTINYSKKQIRISKRINK